VTLATLLLSALAGFLIGVLAAWALIAIPDYARGRRAKLNAYAEMDARFGDSH